LAGYNRPELIEMQLKALLEVEVANVFVSIDIDCDQQGIINSEIRELSVGKYSCFSWIFRRKNWG